MKESKRFFVKYTQNEDTERGETTLTIYRKIYQNIYFQLNLIEMCKKPVEIRKPDVDTHKGTLSQKLTLQGNDLPAGGKNREKSQPTGTQKSKGKRGLLKETNSLTRIDSSPRPADEALGKKQQIRCKHDTKNEYKSRNFSVVRSFEQNEKCDVISRE